jgi:peptidase E
MTPDIKPVYLLAGGRNRGSRKPDPLLQAVFREYSIPSPAVAYVGVASGDDRNFFGFITAAFKEAGAGQIKHALIAPEKADLNKARDILQSADIIFISGGDVEAGMDILNDKNMTSFLFGLYQQGKPFFGLSAGSIMLAREWILWRDPDDDSSAEIFPCLNIASVICDTHAEADEWEELQALLALEKDSVKGYGIPSGTAIKIYPDGRVEALGGAIPQYVHRSGKVIRAADILPVSHG